MTIRTKLPFNSSSSPTKDNSSTISTTTSPAHSPAITATMTTPTPSSSTPTNDNLLLILGAGWTSTFLIPLLQHHAIPYAATTTTGRDSTIKFTFDPTSTDPTPYLALPHASTVLITFPLKGPGQSKKLVEMYRATHPASSSVSSATADDSGATQRKKRKTHFIQLGSTGIFTAPHWNDCGSPYDESNPRAIAEDELRSLGGCVLNLAGLYGGSRDPRNWLGRVARSKEEVRAKGALHLVHGRDVAGAVVRLHVASAEGGFTEGKRWLLADLHVYDWWELFVRWGEGEDEEGEEEENKDTEKGKKPEYRKWVLECMVEDNVRALPRDTARLGRVLDSRDFWVHFGITPRRGSVFEVSD